jgi:hypothetical protein
MKESKMIVHNVVYIGHLIKISDPNLSTNYFEYILGKLCKYSLSNFDTDLIKGHEIKIRQATESEFHYVLAKYA